MNSPGLEPGVLMAGLLVLSMMCSCVPEKKNDTFTFMVADPGHFHAALVLKTPYPGVDTTVYVYAPDGPERLDFNSRVGGFASRAEDPVVWNRVEYRGPDFFEKMMADKPGNVLILAGNNRKKTDYILKAVENGINVFSDKPMAITPADFDKLKTAFAEAESQGVLLYDIMTERFEITSMLQKELLNTPAVFGELMPGTSTDPSVTKESVHHFFKFVSGTRLIRPAWFFDVDQQGEGIADVNTHLADLVQWACFPEQTIDYKSDILISSARHWTTDIRPEQFREVTGLPAYPDYLLSRVNQDSVLQVFANGEISYRLKGIHVRISVAWNYRAPEGGGDTHYSVMKGSLARLEIRQGPEQKFRPELYVMPLSGGNDWKVSLEGAISGLTEKYPGLGLEPADGGYRIVIPEALRTSHEYHFGQVTGRYLSYLKEGRLPAWEVPNMIAKYWLTTTAKKIANE
jgi:predicted dehydrogenase